MSGQENKKNTQAPATILVEPQLGENIGAAARACCNFCLHDFRLVKPRDGWPNPKARSAAANAVHIVDQAKLFESVEEACSDLHFVVATTARSRDMVKPVLSPESAAREMHRRALNGQSCGMLFGRERWGLNNDEVALADAIVIAPVNPDYASLNLAQSVLLMGYEWLKQHNDAVLGRATEFDGPGVEGLQTGQLRPATRRELYDFFEHLERELDRAGFLKPPEKRPAMVRSLRNLFHRLGATDQDIRTLRGIVASLSRRRKKQESLP